MGISALLASQILDASATGRSVITGADASAIRTTLGLGTLATQSPTGTPSASTFLRGDFSWQTIDLSGYLQLTGGTMTGALAINRGVLTALSPAIDVTSTWNNAAVTFTGLRYNVTDTASNANSLLMDLQVGGSSKCRIRKDGVLFLQGATVNDSCQLSNTNIEWRTNSVGTVFQVGESFVSGGWAVQVGALGSFSWRSTNRIDSGSADVILWRDAANTLAQRNSTNAQTFRIYNTFTDSSNYERAKIAWESSVLRIGTEKAGTGSARALELQTDGVTRLTIGSGANHVLTLPDNASIVGGTGTVFRFRYWNSTDNSITFFDCYNTSGFATFSLGATNPRLNFGGTTSSFPSIKRNSAAINFRLADDTGDCDITAKAATFSGNVTISAVNLVTDTTTGTKIGTATNQKLGFFNATPVVQPTAVADATDAASVITQLNALLSRMRDLGLIAT